MKTFKFALFFGVIVAMLVLYADAAFAAQRVLLIGDETVVESAARPDGFTNLLRQFTAEEGQDVEFVPLGVNHATFADWRALLEKSNNENVPIDVEGVDLKDELDKGADVVVIFLGINDALKPSFRGFDGRVYQHIGNHLSTLSSAVGQWANKIGEPLRANVSGLVADVQKRAPGCRVVIADLYEENSSFLNPSAIKFVSRQILSATREQCDHIVVDLFFRNAFEAARFSDEEIRFTRDGLRLNEYGSQLMAWGTLLALVSNRTFDDVLKRAKNAYWTDLAENIAPEPPFDEWEKLARRFYENKVDRRLRDFHSPGFSLYAERWTFTVDERDVPDKYRVVLRCETRGIEATEPVKARNDGVHPMTARVDKIPKIEIVSCGNLQFNQLDVNRSVDFRDKNGASRGAYTLEFYGTPKDFPVDVVLAIGAVQKKIHFFTSGSCNISGVFPLEEEFSNLDDFPQEKAITSVDYAALAGHNPAS